MMVVVVVEAVLYSPTCIPTRIQQTTRFPVLVQSGILAAVLGEYGRTAFLLWSGHSHLIPVGIQ